MLCWVMQGSVLVSVLSLLYIAELLQLVKSNDTHADDTLIYEFSAPQESQSSSTPVFDIFLMFRVAEDFV